MRIVSLWAPPALWCGLIFYLSGIPDLGTGLGFYDLILRKAAHFIEYAVLALLVWRALAGSGSVPPRGIFWGAFGFCVLYAVSDEWHQGFVPGRVPSRLDVLLDSLGALAAVVWKRGRGRRAAA
ncbi:MAG: VanZ family protein [Elusimicrobiota bacterium]